MDDIIKTVIVCATTVIVGAMVTGGIKDVAKTCADGFKDAAKTNAEGFKDAAKTSADGFKEGMKAFMTDSQFGRNLGREIWCALEIVKHFHMIAY